MKKLLLIIFSTALCFNIYATSKEATELTQNWDGAAWQNFGLTTYTYDQYGNELTRTDQGWETGSSTWANSRIITYTNNNDGTANTAVGQLWDSASSSWQNSFRYLYTYTNGNLATRTWQLWQTSLWVNAAMDTFTYNGSGNLLTDTYQSWNGAAWVNALLSTYTYNNNGTVNYWVSQSWSSGWVNQNMYTYTYNGNGKAATYLWQSWQTSSWQNFGLDTYTYDGSGNLATDTSDTWDNTNNVWDYDVVEDYTNNSDGTVDSAVTQSWSPGWVNYQKFIYTYINVTGISNVTTLTTRIYPNPTNNFVNVDMADKNTPFEMALTDICGKMIWDKPDNLNNQIIDFTNLPAGVYLLSVRQDNALSTQKIVKE